MGNCLNKEIRPVPVLRLAPVHIYRCKSKLFNWLDLRKSWVLLESNLNSPQLASFRL
jgi:hypothetical protein